MRAILLWTRYILPVEILLLGTLCFAADQPLERKGMIPVGEIIFVAGKAVARLVPEEAYRVAVPRQELVSGDMIKTGQGGRLSILFRDETQLKLASNTSLMIKEVTPYKERAGALKILLQLESGEVWTRSKSLPEGLTIETPVATAAIRGTEWGMTVRGNESRVIVMEGNVELTSPLGSIVVGRNEQATVTEKQAPVKSILIRPRDRTQWTLYLTERRLLGSLRFQDGTLGKGETLYNEGRLQESAGVFEEILLRHPEDSAALTGLGLIELKKGNHEKAEDCLDRSLRIRRGLLALLGKSCLLMAENRVEEAEEVLRETKEAFPKDPLPYIFFSCLSTLRGDFPEALSECDRGLQILPNDPRLLAFKADLYFILDRPGEAKEAIDLLLGENPDSSEGYERLGTYERMVKGNSKGAKEAFERAIRLDPLNDEAMGKLADLLREEGHFSQARRLIEHALSIAPWNANLRYIYGRLLVDMNRIDEARAQFARSLQLDPTFSRAYLGEGIVLLKEGKPDDAIKELSKASLFEPYLSEVHSFLGIAYYQKHDAGAALKELRTAEECDPLDSTPHQLSSAIYNDLYRPVEAIGEARRVLELFPYRKASGEALLEGAQNGIMSVNYGLNFLDLPEWSLYYALKALFWDPYRNTSHFGVANAYLELGQVSRLQGLNAFLNPYLSEQLQGFTLNVNSLNLSNRYTTLISGPGHYLTLGGTYGTGDSNESLLDLKATGDFGSRFPLTYWLYTNAYWDTGSLPHSEYKEATGRVVLGYKPAYDQDIYMDLNYIKDKGEVTPLESSTLTTPDANQQLKEDMYWIQLGYHKRFSPSSHLLMGLRYLNSLEKAENPDFETDGSGFDSSRTKLRNLAFGLRHMLTLHEDHQVSYGVDYHIVDLSEDESWSYPQLALSYGNQISLKRSTLTPYVYDRWALNSILTLDGGLFLSYYGTESDVEVEDSVAGPSTIKLLDRNALRLNPRLGATLDLGKKGALRVAYQTRSATGFAGELAPVGTSGLISPTFDIFFNEAKDVQGSLEYELTPNTFLKALLGYETLGDIESKTRAQLFYGGIALNQILGRYFSLSARYNYNDGHYRDGSDLKLAGIPLNSGDARLVFVHPWQIAMTLRESYVGQRYADFQNKIKLKGYFSTDFYAQKEMFNKRLFASFSVKDIFNTQFQTASGLPAKGRTFYLRLEYRI